MNEPADNTLNAQHITRLLKQAQGQDSEAIEALYLAIYPVLRRMAAKRLGSRSGGTLTPTVVVNELFLKIDGGSVFDSVDSQHFYTACSRAMRFIVTDFARTALAAKRGGLQPHDSITRTFAAEPDRAQELLDLDAALHDLEAFDSRLRQLVELKFFGGLNYREIGELQGLSERTIKRDWVRARAFLVARNADAS